MHHTSQIYIFGRTDREQIRSRINNNDCRTFRPRRPLSTVYRTVLLVVIDSATYLLTISSPDINKVAMSLYDIIYIFAYSPIMLCDNITLLFHF